jgi:monoamine oxidase
VYEAQGRTGGRSLTLRHDDKVVEVRNGVREVQTFHMDHGLYFNAGPGRIPYHHTAILRWCQELGVELEPYVMETRANLFQTPLAFDTAPVYNRQIANDTRGWLAALLSRAVRDGSLDPALADVDKALLGPARRTTDPPAPATWSRRAWAPPATRCRRFPWRSW